ncbi:uncharacterized protein K452DRAFT_288954 [Aplosporella prunicola CBS 121167]|uniref:Uncharacterized protein n=1 Tax=Aplosporella prunicola CBS 121167 TaxID=1176127 RepID=A0A6A6B9E7_9PEZI|nr:uncharacterized protein K452DRAFT_288954 [Aplosporella prunicola CBS 121167]KAF2140188.1 hypothetical protein K452DRAFT_288954 [Aplosporella prunicola CBS 121167]
MPHHPNAQHQPSPPKTKQSKQAIPPRTPLPTHNALPPDPGPPPPSQRPSLPAATPSFTLPPRTPFLLPPSPLAAPSALSCSCGRTAPRCCRGALDDAPCCCLRGVVREEGAVHGRLWCAVVALKC